MTEVDGRVQHRFFQRLSILRSTLFHTRTFSLRYSDVSWFHFGSDSASVEAEVEVALWWSTSTLRLSPSPSSLLNTPMTVTQLPITGIALQITGEQRIRGDSRLASRADTRFIEQNASKRLLSL